MRGTGDQERQDRQDRQERQFRQERQESCVQWEIEAPLH